MCEIIMICIVIFPYPLNLLSKSIPFSYPYPVQNRQSEDGIAETQQRKKEEFICVSSSYDNKQKTSLPHNPKVVGSNPAPATSMSVHNGFRLWTLIFCFGILFEFGFTNYMLAQALD